MSLPFVLDDGTYLYVQIRAESEPYEDGRVDNALYDRMPADPNGHYMPNQAFKQGLTSVPMMIFLPGRIMPMPVPEEMMEAVGVQAPYESGSAGEQYQPEVWSGNVSSDQIVAEANQRGFVGEAMMEPQMQLTQGQGYVGLALLGVLAYLLMK